MADKTDKTVIYLDDEFAKPLKTSPDNVRMTLRGPTYIKFTLRQAHNDMHISSFSDGISKLLRAGLKDCNILSMQHSIPDKYNTLMGLSDGTDWIALQLQELSQTPYRSKNKVKLYADMPKWLHQAIGTVAAQMNTTFIDMAVYAMVSAISKDKGTVATEKWSVSARNDVKLFRKQLSDSEENLDKLLKLYS